MLNNISKLNEYDLIYMVMTDRFCDGDPKNNGTPGKEYRPGDLHYYQGGDWIGLMHKLEYIKRLGFTAVWMSPPQDNELFSRSRDEAGYHGYYTHDFLHPNPHFGTEKDLRRLIDKAGKLGIKIILDAQLNHTADYLSYTDTEYYPPHYSPAPPFNNPAWYHHTPDIKDFENIFQRHYFCLGGLDDLAQENPECWEALKKAYWDPEKRSGWFSYGFAGARLDAVMEIPERYLSEFEKYVDRPCFGEAYTGSVSVNAPFQKVIWSVLDFPLHFRMHNVFYEHADWTKIQEVFDQDCAYIAPNRLITFLDNHDRPRFLSNACDNYDRLRMVLTFLYCIRGIPVIYYGTEQAIGGDYRYTDDLQNGVNRKMMPSFNENCSLFILVQRLNTIRKNYSDILVDGIQRTVYCIAGDPVYAIIRGDTSGRRWLLGVFNNSPVEQMRRIAFDKYSEKISLTDLLNTNGRINIREGFADVTIQPYGAMLLVCEPDDIFVPKETKKTIIQIRYNCGFGNFLSVRGNVYPLSWEHGMRCDNIGPDLWQLVLERPSDVTIEFKVLINDVIWEQGNNHSIDAHSKECFDPFFSDKQGTLD